MPINEQLKQMIGKALGAIPSGLYILTSRHDGKSGGMLASWVQQAGFDPPAVSIALARERSVAGIIRQSGRLALAIVGESDTELMKRFVRGGEVAFDGLRVLMSENGLPVPAEALAYLDCRVLSVCEFGGDHDLVVAEVVGGGMLKSGKAFVHQRGNGFHY